MAYPTSVWAPTTKNAGDAIQPAHMNDAQAEIVAIETGLTQGTAPLNSSNSTLANLSVAGGSTLAALTVSGASSLASLHVTGNSTFGSTMTIGGIPYQWPSAAPASSGLGLVVQSTGTPNVLKWGAAGTMTLLRAFGGTDANAGATTVDSVAISGLTAKDTLMVLTTLEASSAAVAQANLYSVTDSIAVMAVTNSPLSSGTGAVAQTILAQRQGNSTGMQAGTTISGFGAFGQFTNLTTAWTGSWTLGLRHGGVTAGGTFKYAWQVLKVAGQ